jgi:hypothetical protein
MSFIPRHPCVISHNSSLTQLTEFYEQMHNYLCNLNNMLDGPLRKELPPLPTIVGTDSKSYHISVSKHFLDLQKYFMSFS